MESVTIMKRKAEQGKRNTLQSSLCNLCVHVDCIMWERPLSLCN